MIAKVICIVEWMRKAAAIMARTQHGDTARVLRHIVQCYMPRDIHARSGRAGM